MTTNSRGELVNSFNLIQVHRGDKWSNNAVSQPLNPHLKTLNNNFIKPCTPLPKILNDFCSSLSRIWTHLSFVTRFITLSFVMIMFYRNRDQRHPPSPPFWYSPTNIKGSNMAFYDNYDYYGALTVQCCVCGYFFWILDSILAVNPLLALHWRWQFFGVN